MVWLCYHVHSVRTLCIVISLSIFLCRVLFLLYFVPSDSSIFAFQSLIYIKSPFLFATERRLSNTDLGRYTLDPFIYLGIKLPDTLLTLLWVMLASSGLLFQIYYNRGRPPFPPRPRSIRPEPPVYVTQIEPSR